MTLSFTFNGPDGQTIGAVDGVVFVDAGSPVASLILRANLADAAARQWPVTPTGPWWLGGEGIQDAASVFWAVRHTLPRWTHSGDTPPVPELPAPDPWVVYSPPAAKCSSRVVGAS